MRRLEEIPGWNVDYDKSICIAYVWYNFIEGAEEIGVDLSNTGK